MADPGLDLTWGVVRGRQSRLGIVKGAGELSLKGLTVEVF